MKNIKYPNGFRFSCGLEKFKRCVDIVKLMMENKELLVLYGCIKNIDIEILIDEEMFKSKYTDIDFLEFKKIILDEIVVIMEQNLKFSSYEEPGLREYLVEKEKVDLELAECIITEKKEKRKYVMEQLVDSEDSLRYFFKENTLNNKLYNIDFELNKYIFDDGSDLLYTIIEFGAADELKDDRVPEILAKQSDVKKIKFVCDKQDIDFIIKELEKIKEKM